MVVEAKRDYEEAKKIYKNALKIIIKYNDKYSKEVIINSTFRLNEAITDNSVLNDIEGIINLTKESVYEMYESFINNKIDEVIDVKRKFASKEKGILLFKKYIIICSRYAVQK
jgi:hypothetical protein